LGVTVPAFALPEVARPASPAGWYSTVTRGKIERFMPPFASLNDQQRWDVVAYIMTLHTSEEQVQKGKEIFEANCADCPIDYYKDPNKMSGLSTVALARIVRLGNEEIKAFGENLSDDDMWAVAEYLRSLTYETTPPVAAMPAPATRTPVLAEGKAVGTEQAQVPEVVAPVLEGFGKVSGIIENRTGKELPANFTVTLRGYEHDFANPSAGTQEVLTLVGTVASDGSFVFENVEMPENRIFLAEVTFNGVDLNSEFGIVQAGQISLELPPLVLHDMTEDTSGLIVDELDIFLSTETDQGYEILALYTFRNAGNMVVSVFMGTQEEIPFLKFPVGAKGLGYEAVQDSARFTSTADGFAMAPNDQPYGIIAYSSIPKEKEITINQPLALAVTHVRIFVPDGMKATGDQLSEDNPQDIQGTTYQSYFATGLNAGDMLTFSVTGTPKDTASGTDASGNNNTLLIGAAGLGIALILAGAWMFLRDRKHVDEEDDEEVHEDEEDEFESSEDVMDAIIALDDLYRARKISDEAYQKRRAELKEILKEMM